MGRRSPICSLHSGAVTFWPNSCASQRCFSLKPRWMSQSSSATYSAWVWHWPAEQCVRSKDCSLGYKKIPNRRIRGTHRRCCIAPYFCRGQWTAPKAAQSPVHRRPNIYSRDWDELRLKRILIWRLPLDSLLDLSHLICYCICCRCRIAWNASSKIRN